MSNLHLKIEDRIFIMIRSFHQILYPFHLFQKFLVQKLFSLLDVIVNDYNSNYYMETSKISSEFILLQYFFLFVSQIYKKGNIFVFFMVKFIVTYDVDHY
ncbi:unnamed protein product [Rhizophagus irregularis]|nr:unnamed protein product [Rhizophagus irregularis]